MDRFLRPNLFAARAGRDLVLLDVELGRYDLLPGGGEGARIAACARRLLINDRELEAALADAGCFVDEAAFAPSPDLPPRPPRSVLGCDVRPSFAESLHFAVGWSAMLGRYYGQDLPALIRQSAPRARRLDAPTAEAAQRLAQAYHQLSPWAPFAGDCVFRCFMLLRALRAEGAEGVRWVFGVRTWPFYAHCWLQQGETTLTDHAEPLVSFTPIFAA